MSDQEQNESVLRTVWQIKEASSEMEANAYLRTGWTLIKMFHTPTEGGGEKMNYVFGWCQQNSKPKKPHIRKPA